MAPYAMTRQPSITQGLNELKDKVGAAQSAFARQQQASGGKEIESALARAEQLRQQLEQLKNSGKGQQSQSGRPGQQGKGQQGQGQQNAQNGRGQKGQSPGQQPGAGSQSGNETEPGSQQGGSSAEGPNGSRRPAPGSSSALGVETGVTLG